MPRTKKTQDEQVEEVVEAAKKAVATTRKATKKATEKAAVAAKETAKKAENVTSEAKKAVVNATKKPLKEEIYLQYAGKEINKDAVIKQVKEIWTRQGNKIGEIKTITLYMKPEENKAYYVINGEVSGSVDL